MSSVPPVFLLLYSAGLPRSQFSEYKSSHRDMTNKPYRTNPIEYTGRDPKSHEGPYAPEVEPFPESTIHAPIIALV